MPFADIYRRQVSLLLRVLPFVAAERCFALKGGTAINLFIRDLPRLSVDIDLTYLPVSSREESLAAIDAAMRQIMEHIRKALPAVQIHATETLPEKAITKLLVRHDGVQIKIEVTPVLRGCVYEPELRIVSPAVEAAFGFAEIQVVSFGDLYAGKIVAALDRQHPRDLFDVRDLLANEGIDAALRRAFVVYLMSHNRPIAELVAPKEKSIAPEFLQGFEGMTAKPVSVDELTGARTALIAAILGEMPKEHRRFLLSFKRGEPDWDLLAVPGARDLPAVRWKQRNLDNLSLKERKRLADELEKILFGTPQDASPSTGA
jgi:predicted nucleotidyltransferase component of viral defense system